MTFVRTDCGRFVLTVPLTILAIFGGLAVGSNVRAEERVYMNLGWQDSAGVTTSLNRAAELLERDSDAKIEFLIHGKDIKMFADGYKQRRESIVRLASELSEHDGVTFKVCDHALAFKNLTLEKMPSYFTTVDYVPDRIVDLQEKGYKSLSFESRVER